MGKTRALRCPRVSLVAAFVGILLCAAPVKLDGRVDAARLADALAQSPQTAAEGEVGAPDIAQAIDGIDRLSAFFATLAQNDPNRYAAALWRDQQNAYAGISRRLRDLSAQDRVRMATLPEGGASRIVGQIIVVDRRLGGLWPTDLVRGAPGGRSGDWRYISLLSTALLQGLLRLEPAIGRDWFHNHLARSNLAQAPPTGQTSSIAGIWHIKDKYLWISMLREATADPDLRADLDSRRINLRSEALSASAALNQALGADWGEALWEDWQEYARQVGRFSSSRSWLTTERRRMPGKSAPALPPDERIDAPPPTPGPDALRQAVPPATPDEAAGAS